jgi:hypothetical protein
MNLMHKLIYQLKYASDSENDNGNLHLHFCSGWWGPLHLRIYLQYKFEKNITGRNENYNELFLEYMKNHCDLINYAVWGTIR